MTYRCYFNHLLIRTDAEAETPILWPPHAGSWLIGKDPDTGRDWGQEEKGMTEDEMAGWHHWLNAHEFGWTPGVGGEGGPGGLVYCDLWGRKESDTTERLNWTELKPSQVNSLLFYTCESCVINFYHILHHLNILTLLKCLIFNPLFLQFPYFSCLSSTCPFASLFPKSLPSNSCLRIYSTK